MGKITRSKSYNDTRHQDINGVAPRTKARPRKIDLNVSTETDTTESTPEDALPDIIVPIPKRFVPQDLTDRVEQVGQEETRPATNGQVPSHLLGHSISQTERDVPPRTEPEPSIPPPQPTSNYNFNNGSSGGLGQPPRSDTGHIAPDGNITTTTTVTIKLTTVTTTNPANGATTTSVFTEIVPVTTAANNSNDDATVTFQQMEPSFTPMSPKISSIPNFNPSPHLNSVANGINHATNVSSPNGSPANMNTGVVNQADISSRNNAGSPFNNSPAGNPANNNSPNSASGHRSIGSVASSKRNLGNSNILQNTSDNNLDRDPLSTPIIPLNNSPINNATQINNETSSHAGQSFSQAPDQTSEISQVQSPVIENMQPFESTSNTNEDSRLFIESSQSSDNTINPISSSSFIPPSNLTENVSPYMNASPGSKNSPPFINRSNETPGGGSFIKNSNQASSASSFRNTPNSMESLPSIRNYANTTDGAQSYINAPIPTNGGTYGRDSLSTAVIPETPPITNFSSTGFKPIPVLEVNGNPVYNGYIPSQSTPMVNYNAPSMDNYGPLPPINYPEPSHMNSSYANNNTNLYMENQALDEITSPGSIGTLGSVSSLSPAVNLSPGISMRSQNIVPYDDSPSPVDNRSHAEVEEDSDSLVDEYEDAGSSSYSPYPDSSGPSSPLTRPRYYRLPELGTLGSIYDLWDEWHVGIRGNPSIKEMQEKYGAKWRADNSSRLSRRKRIIKEITRRINEGMSEQTALDSLERMRGENSVNWVHDQFARRR